MNKEDKKKLDFIRFLTIIAEEYIKAGGSTKIAAGIVAGQNYGVGANILHAAMSRAYELDRGVGEGAVKLDDAAILRLMRDNFNEKTVEHLTITRWKDGIDLQFPDYAIKGFVRALLAVFPNAKEPEDNDE